MKIKVGDITARQRQRVCESRTSCQDCKLSRGWNFPECMYSDSSYFDVEVELPEKYFKEFEDNEVCLPDECFNPPLMTNKKSENEKKSGSTFWNGQISQNDYRLQFQTTDKDLYKIVEAAAQLAIDISNKKKEKENEV